MAGIIRGLDQFLEDLDKRQRPEPPSKNRALQRLQSITDTVGLSSDVVATTLTTPPFQWETAASTAQSIIWGQFEWS